MNDEVAAPILESGDHISALERNHGRRPSLGLRNIWSKFYTSIINVLIAYTKVSHLSSSDISPDMLSFVRYMSDYILHPESGGGRVVICVSTYSWPSNTNN